LAALTGAYVMAQHAYLVDLLKRRQAAGLPIR
jgi:hypothetical protein